MPKLRKLLGLLLLLAGLLVMPVSQGWAEQGTTLFSGEAFGASVMTTIGTTYYADTGLLPLSGGEIDAVTPIALPPPFFSGGVVSLSTTSGSDVEADSQAIASGMVLSSLAAETLITAGSIAAQSSATCDSASGASQIANLVVGGIPIVVTGAVDQSITGLFGTLVLNEQIPTTTGITVNAFHLTNPFGIEVIVASAHSDIQCLGFVTGGGWITVNGAKGTFGFNAGKDSSNGLQGNLEYLDHGTGMNVHAIDETSYAGSGNTRTFGGDATINGVPGYTYVVTVQSGPDTFSISLSNGYAASGALGGGHIQIHV